MTLTKKELIIQENMLKRIKELEDKCKQFENKITAMNRLMIRYKQIQTKLK